MKPLAVILIHQPPSHPSPTGQTQLLHQLDNSPHIEKVITLQPAAESHSTGITAENPLGGPAIMQALDAAGDCPYVLVVPEPAGLEISHAETERLVAVAEKQYGALYYADYFCGTRTPAGVRAVADYQTGSIRDDFYFGPFQLYSASHVRQALQQHGQLTHTRWGGLYELRLKVSLTGAVVRVPEPLALAASDRRDQGSHFGYVDPQQHEFQKEMERVASAHLSRVGALCSHEYRTVPCDPSSSPVTASVIIPVRNRQGTIADAIESALGQQTGFPYNVIVVQNHSTDGTAAKIRKLARRDRRVVQIVPRSTDLGIGGCWNTAVQSPACGHYVCQLDSDDLYGSPHALASMIDLLRGGNFGMAVGSYRLVDATLSEIPPGVVDHREWSNANGRNNLLRVNGIGAPRAFPTVLLKQHPFPNISYGEDYAVALRISRDYRVGRIFEPLYLCRRWEGNTDARLTNLEANRLAMIKDRLRTDEILERRAANQSRLQMQGRTLP